MSAHTPTSASGQATAKGLRAYSRFASEYVMDRKIIDLYNFQNFVEHDPDNTEGMGAGAPEFGEVTTSEIGAVLMASDNDSYGHLWVLPYDVDVDEQIDFRCLWSNSEAAGTGTNTWIVKYTAIDTSAQTALAVGATALDTVITINQVDLGANIPLWSDWGSISAGKAGINTLEGANDALALKTYVDLTTIANASLIQMQVRYYRKYI